MQAWNAVFTRVPCWRFPRFVNKKGDRGGDSPTRRAAQASVYGYFAGRPIRRLGNGPSRVRFCALRIHHAAPGISALVPMFRPI